MKFRLEISKYYFGTNDKDIPIQCCYAIVWGIQKYDKEINETIFTGNNQ